MGLGGSLDLATNVLDMYFAASDGYLMLAFDSDGAMNIVASERDGGAANARWALCALDASEPEHITLAWILGTAEPDIASCVRVSIKRTFTNDTVAHT